MKEKDKKKIINRYESRLKQFGPVQKSLGWLRGRQRFRFHYLKQVTGFEKNDSVLDIGCGYGDLWRHLQQNGWKGKYTGIDIVPGLINEANKRYPKINFRLTDITSGKFNEVHDWVFSSGALTSKTEEIDSHEHIRQMLQKMFALCRKGVSANFCSPLVDFESDVNFHPQFDRILKITSELTKRFVLRHDYMPYEFTLYLYKNDAVNTKSNVFQSEMKLYNQLKVID
ncbi:MAG: class I SAM-dependent methyltransferase [Bacteroidetes bacterium]|nr:class I SAM-dependent methyltransferase [Bacteroidota bacterium]